MILALFARASTVLLAASSAFYCQTLFSQTARFQTVADSIEYARIQQIPDAKAREQATFEYQLRVNPAFRDEYERAGKVSAQYSDEALKAMSEDERRKALGLGAAPTMPAVVTNGQGTEPARNEGSRNVGQSETEPGQPQAPSAKPFKPARAYTDEELKGMSEAERQMALFGEVREVLPARAYEPYTQDPATGKIRVRRADISLLEPSVQEEIKRKPEAFLIIEE